MAPAIVWFRRNLRLDDNVPLDAALRAHDGVVPVFVLDDHYLTEDFSRPRLRFLAESLGELEADLAAKGSRLLFRKGPAGEALATLARETGAEAVYTHFDHEPHGAELAREAEASLVGAGDEAEAPLRPPPRPALVRSGPRRENPSPSTPRSRAAGARRTRRTPSPRHRGSPRRPPSSTPDSRRSRCHGPAAFAWRARPRTRRAASARGEGSGTRSARARSTATPRRGTTPASPARPASRRTCASGRSASAAFSPRRGPGGRKPTPPAAGRSTSSSASWRGGSSTRRSSRRSRAS